MKHLIPLLLISALSFGFYSPIQEKKSINPTLSSEELKLYKLIIAYRKTKNLPAIPLSKSLTFVAQTHCSDLSTNHPDHGECNAHSWSGKGIWTACCYTSDHKKAGCMWNKPKELTNYKGQGFEICCTGSSSAEDALDCWKGSVHHNDVILNKDIWKSRKWKAIGIGMRNGYAIVWFGSETDPDGEPKKATK